VKNTEKVKKFREN